MLHCVVTSYIFLRENRKKCDKKWIITCLWSKHQATFKKWWCMKNDDTCRSSSTMLNYVLQKELYGLTCNYDGKPFQSNFHIVLFVKWV